MATGALMVALIVAMARRPAAWLNAQFWAEDGSVFFAQAVDLQMRAFITPHAGYHHFSQRLLAGGLVELPLVWLPTAFVVATTFVWSGVVLMLFSPRLPVKWPWAMMAVMVLLPSSNEIWFNLTNLQWTTALLVPLWLVAGDPQTKKSFTVQLVASVVVGLTGVFSVAAAPLFVVRAIIRRTWIAGIMAAGWVVTGGIQLFTTKSEGAATVISLPLAESAMIVGKRVMGTLFMPSRMPADWLVYGGLILGGGGLIWTGWRCWRTPSLRPYLFWAGFAGLVGLATLWRFQANLGDLRPVENGERYFFVPKVIVLWGLIQLAAQASRERWVAVAGLGLALTFALPAFKLPPLVDNGWPHWAERIEAGERGWVPITPDGFRFIPPAGASKKSP